MMKHIYLSLLIICLVACCLAAGCAQISPDAANGETEPSTVEATDNTREPTNPDEDGIGLPEVTIPVANETQPSAGDSTDLLDPSDPNDPPEAELVFRITYEGLMGATHKNPDTYTAATASAIIFTAPSAIDGYSFDGWYVNGVKITSLAGFAQDITITAQWTVNSGGVIVLPDVDF